MDNDGRAPCTETDSFPLCGAPPLPRLYRYNQDTNLADGKGWPEHVELRTVSDLEQRLVQRRQNRVASHPATVESEENQQQ